MNNLLNNFLYTTPSLQTGSLMTDKIDEKKGRKRGNRRIKLQISDEEEIGAFTLGYIDNQKNFNEINEYRLIPASQYLLLNRKMNNYEEEIDNYEIILNEFYEVYFQEYFRKKYTNEPYDMSKETKEHIDLIKKLQENYIREYHGCSIDEFIDEKCHYGIRNIEGVIRIVNNNMPIFDTNERRIYADWLERFSDCWLNDDNFTNHIKRKIEDELCYEED